MDTALVPASTGITVVEQSSASLAQQFGELTVESMLERKKKINVVLTSVMREGEHYGTIPGTGNKPTLLKAGAEVLATTFGLAPAFTVRRADLPGGHREYEITCQLRHIATGAMLGEGLGSCSTMESKYRWRRGERKCPTCGAAAILRSKYPDRETNVAGWYCSDRKGGCNAQFPANAPAIVDQPTGRAEHPDIADTYNTVLKMAKKRAQVDATLTAVGASDLLTQDLEDLEREDHGAAPAAAATTQRTSSPPSTAKPANPPGTAPVTPDLVHDPRAEQLAIKLIAALNEATAEEQVEQLAEKASRLPKGTRARRDAYDAYQRAYRRIRKTTEH